MSRTSARQQRMREQTLNEECILQDELGSRTSSECRSKGSKLIISSPTTTSHPCLNLLLSGSQAPTQQTDDNAKLTSHYNRGFGASALLASLNATGHQHQTDTHPTRLFQPTVESQQISQLAERNYQQRNLDFTNCSPSLLATNSVINQNSADNNRSSVYVLSTSNRAPNQSLPMHFSYRNLPHGSTKHIQSKRSSFDDGISSNTQVKSNSELSMLEMESIESPTPSDMNSPVESCFANIMEDQGSDSFDLNNITPSINLSSSVGISDSTSDFPHQTPNSSERLQQTTSTSTTAKTMLQTGNKLDSLVQISPVDVNSFFLKESTKANRDDTGMTVSSSCPANVPDDLCMTDNSTSPLQSGSRAPQSVLSESGSSPLGGLNSTPEGTSLPVSHGPLSIGNISSPTSGRNVDDQRVAWMRDRSKKDSHNRIERKRRDYINCQIAELGSLLPEDMFRDGDGKKNKGNILKNSVEFICLLRSELAQIPEVRRETSLAAKVIGQLVKRIQELESVTNVASLQTPHSNRNNSDYQNLYQEWSMLHENNLLHSMPLCSTNSPITRCSFPQSTTAGGGSSPGLSSVGTDEMNSSDTKVVFSNSMNSPIFGSAPVRSNPLGSFPRINSPVSNANFSTRPTGGSGTVVESPLRLIRARCTSLTVSTTGGNSSSNDVNMSSVRIHAPEYQQHQTNKMRNQRIFQPNQSQLRISQPNNQSHLCSSQFQSKPIPQSPHPSSSLSPQHQLTVQHQIQPSSRSGMTFGSIPNQQYINTHNISASLPVNVNPLLCGIQDSDNNDLNDDKIAQLYSFDSSTSPFIPHLKSEPICETDSNHNSSIHSLSLDLCHGNTMNTILEPVTHFDPLIASVMQSSSQHYQQQQQQQQQHQLQHQPYQDQPPLSHHHQHHQHQHPQHYPHDQYNSQHQLHKQSQQPQQQQHQQQQHQHQQCSFINHTGKSSTKTLDLSTPPILGLDIDEFQFDDVPME